MSVTSLLAQLVKNPAAVQETLVQCLGWEDSLEKGTCFNAILPNPPTLSLSHRVHNLLIHALAKINVFMESIHLYQDSCEIEYFLT